MPLPPYQPVLRELSTTSRELRSGVEAYYHYFANHGLPSGLEEYLLNEFGIDVSSTYAGMPIMNPWGKASGQLSMMAHQVADDVAAGLGFVVLKTVIAQDETGTQTMQAWAIPEAKMVVEKITSESGTTGWTVSWKGRGWWQSFEDYLELFRQSQQLAKNTGTLIVPSCKFHLPTANEPAWKTAEYDYTVPKLLEAWTLDGVSHPMPLEKDFSPTLAGSDKATEQAQILSWLNTVPRLIRAAGPVTVGLKLFNALFEDEFQLEMLRAIHQCGPDQPDFFIYGNRLFDPHREFEGHKGIAYGGPDLSDRNLRVMAAFQQELALGATASLSGSADVAKTTAGQASSGTQKQQSLKPLTKTTAGQASSGTQKQQSLKPLAWSATGNITTGQMALEYALCGASSFQLHTFFQLPNDQYRMTQGTRTERVLHELYFHPETGLIVWMHDIANRLGTNSHPLRFQDLVGRRLELARLNGPG